MRGRRFGAWTIALAGFAATAANASDWRYCYAFAPTNQRFYMSRGFESQEPLETVERDFLAFLAREGIADARTGCPRGADSENLSNRSRSAALYSREEGNVVVDLAWPAP
ncbi:MAG: hypothetical protein JO048_10315, partial [Methylobacteriaceae bacterium]|nr:hypothetical protein [Methylobacteriaceae bacterium]